MEYIGNKKKQGSIVELLRDEILAGNIPDGSEMTQNELAEGLGVSRMPVREAPILLEYRDRSTVCRTIMYGWLLLQKIISVIF